MATLAACGEPAATRQQAVGEPVGDVPSYSERALLYFTNRARTAPADFNADDPYPPSAPLQFDFDLAIAARFHARHIVEASCWCADHSSCCALEGEGEDVACASAAGSCGATSAEARVARFSPHYGGENMALGQRNAAEAIASWTTSPGHWENINRPGFTRLGAGHFGDAWVQDFGTGNAPRQVISDGIHFSDGASTRFGTTYHLAGDGPQSALVIVEGVCHDLELVHGTPELGAFEVAVALDAGCHRYYFHFTDSAGNDVTYPTFGSLGVGDADCELFVDTRPADTCSPSGQTCETGDTRHCYTGKFGTEGVGVCEAGVERCVAGKWAGECRLQVQPSEEVCDNGLDDDCDGEVDEGCGSAQDGDDSETGETGEDGGEQGDTPSGKNAGCAVAAGNTNLWMIAFALLLGRRRRRQRD